MGKKKVVILDFDGTIYSSDHVFDKIDNFIVRHRREFLPNITDEDYAKIVKDYPEWKKTFAATEIVEYLYLFKKKYPEMQISIKDFYDWQDAHPDPLVLDDVKIANQKFLKELCEEFPTYIVSNSPLNHIEHYMKKLNIEPEWFKKIYSNHFIARDRSKKHYYEEIMKKEECKPKDVYVFGDSVQNDLEPAKELGINVCFVSKANRLKNEILKVLKPE